jgi:hypothetical protein
MRGVQGSVASGQQARAITAMRSAVSTAGSSGRSRARGRHPRGAHRRRGARAKLAGGEPRHGDAADDPGQIALRKGAGRRAGRVRSGALPENRGQPVRVMAEDVRPAGYAERVPIHLVEARHRMGRSLRRAAFEQLQQVAVARSRQRYQLRGRDKAAIRPAHRLERGDADGRDAEGKRKAARGGDGDADAGEVAGSHTHGDGVERRTGDGAASPNGLDQGHEPFGLTLGHGFEPLRQNPVATQQSGRAMRGRCVEAEDRGRQTLTGRTSSTSGM